MKARTIILPTVLPKLTYDDQPKALIAPTYDVDSTSRVTISFKILNGRVCF